MPSSLVLLMVLLAAPSQAPSEAAPGDNVETEGATAPAEDAPAEDAAAEDAAAEDAAAGGEAPPGPPPVPPLQRCREAGAAGDHRGALAACTEAVAEGGLSVEEWIVAERHATRAHFALGQLDEGQARLLSILVLDPAFTLGDDAPEAMKTAFGPTARQMLREGRIDIEHTPPASLTAMRHEALTFIIADPLARISQAEVLFEFVDANETKGFAQVPLSRRSAPDGRSMWTGRAPEMAWPPRIVRYQLQLTSPARTAIELEMGPTTLKPDPDLLAQQEKEAELQKDIKRPEVTSTPVVPDDEPFPVVLATAATFSAFTFGAAVASVALFAVATVGTSIGGFGLGLDPGQQQALSALGAGAGVVAILMIPATLLLGAVSVGLWSYYLVSDGE
jgi:hypothetical protein